MVGYECLEIVIADWFKVKIVWFYKLKLQQETKNNGQGIIQTKMEVGIQFWAPNLGLSPKYD